MPELTLSNLFDLANLFVLPFWALIVLLPNWGVTRRVMQSNLPFIVLAGFYLYCIGQSLDAESAEALSNPSLSQIAKFFGDEAAAATGWAHFLVMDLFVGRWIYWEGQRTGIWTTHSILLCLFAGPVGVLSHIFTTTVRDTFFAARDASDGVATEGTSTESAQT